MEYFIRIEGVPQLFDPLLVDFLWPIGRDHHCVYCILLCNALYILQESQLMVVNYVFVITHCTCTTEMTTLCSLIVSISHPWFHPKVRYNQGVIFLIESHLEGLCDNIDSYIIYDNHILKTFKDSFINSCIACIKANSNWMILYLVLYAKSNKKGCNLFARYCALLLSSLLMFGLACAGFEQVYIRVSSKCTGEFQVELWVSNCDWFSLALKDLRTWRSFAFEVESCGRDR
jgi:hypothetical protein